MLRLAQFSLIRAPHPRAWRLQLPAPITCSLHSRLATLIAVLLALPASPTGLASQDPTTYEADADVVQLNFQSTDLSIVIAALADLAGLTVVHSGLPPVPVTLRGSAPTPRSELRGLLESLATSNGLTVSQDGNIVRIENPAAMAADTYLSAQAMSQAAPDTRVFVRRLSHAKAEAVAGTLRDVFGLGRSQEGTLPPAGLNRGSRAPLMLQPGTEQMNNSPSTVPIYSIGVGSPSITGQLQSPVHVVPDAATNSLLVRTSAADFEVLEQAIAQLDSRPLQVLIEMLIVEVRRDRRRDLGVDVTGAEWTDPGSGITIEGQLTGASAGDLTARILGLGGLDAEVILRALASNSEITILSRPIILAQNNQTARILVGSQRPFIQLFRALPTDAAVRDQVVQYRDVGTQLTITPTINEDGYVTLALLQEVSTATSETQFGAPVISTREAETQLFVRDRHTAVLGGLIDDQRESVNSGIPFLKDLPLLGLLFRSTQTRRGATELFLLITPHVLRTDEDVEAAGRQMRGRSPALERELQSREDASELGEPTDTIGGSRNPEL